MRLNFEFDPNNIDSIYNIIQKFGGDNITYHGEDEYGNIVFITPSQIDNSITVETLQTNGWFRINTYYLNGTVTETFEK